MKATRVNVIDLIVCIICIFYTITGIIVSLHRYWQYEVSYIDFGQYDQIIWKVSQFQAPIVNHFIHGEIHVFGDHLTPSIFLLSPFYWFTDRPEMILVIQAITVGISGIFLYEIGKHVLKDRISALSILISYFFFIGLQNAVITEFHELTIMTLPFMASIWAAVKNKFKVYYILLIITLGFKEVTFSLGIGLGLSLIFLNKKWMKVGINTIILSVIWGIISLKFIIPYFNHGEYLYVSNLPNGVASKLSGLIDHSIKRRTLFFSFFSFSFLPLISPQFWIGILQDYASRFIPANFITRWDLAMHYNAQSAVWLAVSSVFSFKYLLRIGTVRRYKLLLSLFLILNSFFIFRFILHGPFLLALNPAFYKQTSNLRFLNKMVESVPRGRSVMTHNNLAARFTHQQIQLLIPDYEKSKPEYILIDLREGQSPNNFCCNLNLDSAIIINNRLLNDKKYDLVYKTKEQFVFKRK